MRIYRLFKVSFSHLRQTYQTFVRKLLATTFLEETHPGAAFTTIGLSRLSVTKTGVLPTDLYPGEQGVQDLRRQNVETEQHFRHPFSHNLVKFFKNFFQKHFCLSLVK
jgi:hypothetical protein